MKKIFFTLFIVFGVAAINVSAQNVTETTEQKSVTSTEDVPQIGHDKLYDDYQILSQQLAKTNRCIDKYARQSLTGELLMIGGSVLCSTSIFMKNDGVQTLTSLSGAALVISGYIVKLTAYNKIKSTSLQYDGLKLTYNF